MPPRARNRLAADAAIQAINQRRAVAFAIGQRNRGQVFPALPQVGNLPPIPRPPPRVRGLPPIPPPVAAVPPPAPPPQRQVAANAIAQGFGNIQFIRTSSGVQVNIRNQLQLSQDEKDYLDYLASVLDTHNDFYGNRGSLIQGAQDDINYIRGHARRQHNAAPQLSPAARSLIDQYDFVPLRIPNQPANIDIIGLQRHVLRQNPARAARPQYFGWTKDTAAVFSMQALTNDDRVVRITCLGASATMGSSERPFCMIYSINHILKDRLRYHFGLQHKNGLSGWIGRVLEAIGLTRFEVTMAGGLSLDQGIQLYQMGLSLVYPPHYDGPESHAICRTMQLNQHLSGDIVNELLEAKVDCLVFKDCHAMAFQSITYEGVLTDLPLNDQIALERFYSRRDGILFYDFETRPDATHELRDVICHVHYRKSNMKTPEGEDPVFDHIDFTTQVGVNDNGEEIYITSARIFLDWLAEQPVRYTCYAHNGSNFDAYFICNAMSNTDLMSYFNSERRRVTHQGQSILSIDYRGHRFLDTCKFLAAPLSALGKSFLPDKPELWKHDKATFWDEERKEIVEISTTELCFYRPELSFKEFLHLVNTSQAAEFYDDDDGRKIVVPSFGDAYHYYCQQDTICLAYVWTRYEKAVKSMIKNMANESDDMTKHELYQRASVRSCVTLGQHQVQLFKAVNTTSTNYKRYTDALSKDTALVTFFNQVKLGGMSICDRPGLYLDAGVVYDVRSLYPTALVCGVYPGGKPRWIDGSDQKSLDELTHQVLSKEGCIPAALVRVKNARFNCPQRMRIGPPGPYQLTYRPVLELDPIRSNQIRGMRHMGDKDRTWLSFADEMGEFTCSTIALRYMMDWLGLVSFTIVQACEWKTWIPGAALFGKYVSTLYKIKAEQDLLRDAKDPAYNEAERETVKLAMNTITGKLGQTESGRHNICFVKTDTSNPTPFDFSEFHDGYEIRETPQEISEKSKPDQTPAYIMCLEYSKLLMFQYLSCLESFENIIAIETDSIHIEGRHEAYFNDQCAMMESKQGGWILPKDKLFHYPCKQCIYPSQDVTCQNDSDEYYRFFPSFSVRPDTVALGTLNVEKRPIWSAYLGKKKYFLQLKDTLAYPVSEDEKDQPKGVCIMRCSGLKETHLLEDGRRMRILYVRDYMTVLFQSLLWVYETNTDIKKRPEYAFTQVFRNLKKNLLLLSIMELNVKRSVMPNPNMNIYFDPTRVPSDITIDDYIAGRIQDVLTRFVSEIDDTTQQKLYQLRRMMYFQEKMNIPFIMQDFHPDPELRPSTPVEEY